MPDKMPKAWTYNSGRYDAENGKTRQPWPTPEEIYNPTQEQPLAQPPRQQPLALTDTTSTEIVVHTPGKIPVMKYTPNFVLPGSTSLPQGRPQHTWQRARFKIAVTRWATMSYWRVLRQLGAEIYEVRESTLLSDFDKCDGLLIPGGRDVSPAWYNEPQHSKAQDPDQNRDATEIALINHAIELDMPVLGVCRGHQLLNVALGGSLNQHIEDHVVMKHPVTITPESKHLEFIREENDIFYVNSLHHQSIERLGNGLIAAAVSDDGVIEAVEHPGHKFVVGVQWHPEMTCTPRFERSMDKLITKFMEAGGKEKK